MPLLESTVPTSNAGRGRIETWTRNTRLPRGYATRRSDYHTTSAVAEAAKGGHQARRTFQDVKHAFASAKREALKKQTEPSLRTIDRELFAGCRIQAHIALPVEGKSCSRYRGAEH